MEMNEIEAALAALDSEIGEARTALTEAQTRLDELTLKRTGAEAFIEYMQTLPKASQRGVTSPPLRVKQPAQGKTISSGNTAVLEGIMRRSGGQVLTAADVKKLAEDEGHLFTAEQVRNGLHYLWTKKIIVKGAERGQWSLKTPEASADTEASDGNAPTQLRGGGDSHETTAQTAFTAEHQFHAQLGASIAEVAS